MNTLLVPLDFSETSTDAYKFALDLAAITKSRIYALHVIDLPLSQLKEEAISKFETLQAKYNSRSIETSLFIELGGIIETIERLIEEHKPTAVVMGTKGASGLKEIVIGSNTEKVIRNSMAPVWTIPNYINPSVINNIVLPTDLDLNQADFIYHVLQLQKMLNATIHILYIETSSESKREDEIMMRLDEFKKTYGFSRATVNVRSAADEKDGIIRFAKETGSQLVAMGTHARKGLAHWVSGSLTEEVANQIDFPLFTAHIN